MPSWTEWLQGWRGIADGVAEGHYETITVTMAGRDYDVLHVSAYDADIDSERRAIRTSAREFDDRVALYSRRTRDVGLVRLICVRGQPRYVLEPGADAVDWAAELEGVSVRDLTLSARDGALGRRVARLVRHSERRSRERNEAEMQALRERVEDLANEGESLKAELKRRETEFERGGES